MMAYVHLKTLAPIRAEISVTEIFIGKKEKLTNKGTDKQYVAVFVTQYNSSLSLSAFSSWCLVMVERLFLAVPRGCLQFVLVVFSDHTNLPFLYQISES